MSLMLSDEQEVSALHGTVGTCQVPCCAVLCNAMVRHAMLCCAVLCCAVLCYALLFEGDPVMLTKL